MGRSLRDSRCGASANPSLICFEKRSCNVQGIWTGVGSSTSGSSEWKVCVCCEVNKSEKIVTRWRLSPVVEERRGNQVRVGQMSQTDQRSGVASTLNQWNTCPSVYLHSFHYSQGKVRPTCRRLLPSAIFLKPRPSPVPTLTFSRFRSWRAANKDCAPTRVACNLFRHSLVIEVWDSGPLPRILKTHWKG